jgi:hypothetical protein
MPKSKKPRKTFSRAARSRIAREAQHAERAKAAAAMRDRMKKTIMDVSKKFKVAPINMRVHEPILSEAQRKAQRDKALEGGNTQMAKDIERYETLLNEAQHTEKLVEFNKGQVAKRQTERGKEAAQKAVSKLTEKLANTYAELEQLKDKLFN